MKTAIIQLESVSAYSQGRYHNTPEKAKELPQDWEERTWAATASRDSQATHVNSCCSLVQRFLFCSVISHLGAALATPGAKPPPRGALNHKVTFTIAGLAFPHFLR